MIIIPHIIPLEKNEIEMAINLFDKDFFFMTTYPQLVSSIELKNFILSKEKFYKIIEEGNIIGIAYYVAHNPNYVFFKLRVSQNKIEIKAYENLIINFLSLIKAEVAVVERIETYAYEFDKADVQLLDKLGIKREVTKSKDIYKDNQFWCSYVYSLIDEEIENITKGEKNE